MGVRIALETRKQGYSPDVMGELECIVKTNAPGFAL